VTVSVTDAAPESTVALTITHAQGKVSRFNAEKTVNAEGTAVFELHPEGKAVLGEYNVTVDVEGAEDLTGSFTVVTNGTEVERDDDEDDAQGGDSGEGSDSGDNGSEGSGSGSDNSRSGNAADLPRTGTELTGVALGAGLLVVGAAAVVLTRRRGASSDPAEN
jgi:LPXTG-motif cell wall-anchored protein